MSAPLRLPLEVIERILFFALGGDEPPATPDTCVERITPPPSTAHLLRVSKGITAIALPLYWKSVTILSSTDWVHLLSETGLLAGEAGQERAEWVRELRINVDPHARIPIDLEAVEKAVFDNDDSDAQDASELLVKLDEEVFFPHLKHVCLFSFKPSSGSMRTRNVSLAESVVRQRFPPSDDAWFDAAESAWEEEVDERWRAHNSYPSVMDEEDSDDDHAAYRRNQWGVYTRRGREEEAREDWMATDYEDLQLAQEARRDDLRLERRSAIHMIFGINDDIRTFRTPTDYEALDLARGVSTQCVPRITVYPGVYEDSWKALSTARLDPVSMYDFADVQPFARALLVGWLRDEHGDTALKGWRWVNDDGTTTPLVG